MRLISNSWSGDSGWRWRFKFALPPVLFALRSEPTESVTGPTCLISDDTCFLTPLMSSTRGYKVYRHKGRYYVYYNHYGSYPSVFGLRELHEIPRNASKEVFEEWVREAREYVYAQRDSRA
jgi:hypothetical protein